MQHALILIVSLFAAWTQVYALDYVQLRSGRLIEGAVIRQDTTAIFVTAWEQRYLRQPELQVFARSEIESIWLGQKPTRTLVRKFVPRTGQFEAGGGLDLQTWASSLHHRRHLVQLSGLIGTSITDYLATELVGNITAPFAQSKDPDYDSLEFSYQLVLHIVANINMDRPYVPFAFVGAGVGRDVPRAGVIETASFDDRSLIEFGAGLKMGFNGLGIRAELKHAYYHWSKKHLIGTFNGEEFYTTRQSADATSLRVFLFTYF
jgi:hypothetical protein